MGRVKYQKEMLMIWYDTCCEISKLHLGTDLWFLHLKNDSKLTGDFYTWKMNSEICHWISAPRKWDLIAADLTKKNSSKSDCFKKPVFVNENAQFWRLNRLVTTNGFGDFDNRPIWAVNRKKTWKFYKIAHRDSRLSYLPLFRRLF